MPDQFAEMNGIIARLERLEKENRNLKRTGVSVLVLVAAIFLMGQAQTNKTVEATQFNIKDSSGKIRGALGTYEGLTQLTLYGPEGAIGKPGASMVAVGNGKQGPYVTFTDADSKTRLELGMGQGDQPGLWLYNGAAEAVASLVAAGDTASLGLGRVGGREQFEASVVPDYGPHVILSDKNGFVTAVGATDLQTPRTGKTQRTSAASVILFGKDKSVLWSAP